MIGLGRIERPVRFNSCDDGLLERMGLIELRDVGLRDVRLLGVGRERSPSDTAGRYPDPVD